MCKSHHFKGNDITAEICSGKHGLTPGAIKFHTYPVTPQKLDFTSLDISAILVLNEILVGHRMLAKVDNYSIFGCHWSHN